MNPVFKLLQSLPTNGWTTVLGAVLAITFGVSGIATNHLDISTGISSIGIGLSALGLGSKIEKAKAEYQALKALLPAGISEQILGQVQ